ncbi:hypothetical protein AVEN_164070-1 [Araneus ventricosus]|uniref:Uncharacterized protein n=1 Tax=Araneus ventricosus TaxID=182803 RepID=A0A4Y2MSF6_ARAVE|nr:hypothetical protein AVEN_164070-1 [Araneus ventricosus]
MSGFYVKTSQTGVTPTCQSAAKSYKSWHIFVTVGRECLGSYVKTSQAGVTPTSQSIAKSYKIWHVFVTVGRECDKQLTHPRGSRPQRVNIRMLLHVLK